MDPPVVTTIAPDDPWWDDLATPLTRECVAEYLLPVYDAYINTRSVYGQKSYQYYTKSITCNVMGGHAPLMIILYGASSYATCDIHCRLWSRGELVGRWYREIIRSRCIDDVVVTLPDDVRTELIRRNQAVDDTKLIEHLTPQKCRAVMYNYLIVMQH